MNPHSIKEISTSADRHKLYTLMCRPDELPANISFVNSQEIPVINIGKEVASFIETLTDYRYLNIDVLDYTRNLLEKRKAKIKGVGNDVIAIYNLGILLEPALELNAAQLLKDFSKSTAIIIIWENQSDLPDRLNWQTQNQSIFLDFTDTHLKKLQYAI